VIVEGCPLFGQKWLSKAKRIVKSKYIYERTIEEDGDAAK